MILYYRKIEAESRAWSCKASENTRYSTQFQNDKETCYRIRKLDSFDRTREGLLSTLNCFSKKETAGKYQKDTFWDLQYSLDLNEHYHTVFQHLIGYFIFEMSLTLQIPFQQLPILLTTKHHLLTCPTQTTIRSSSAHLAQILLTPMVR